jgi:hypothetical protein
VGSANLCVLADIQLIAQHTRLAKSGQTGVEKKLSVLSTISNASGAYLEPILGGSVGTLILPINTPDIVDQSISS